jgi:type IV secretory pathway VirD2 relaxase
MVRKYYDELYRPKARSRLVPGQRESLRRHVWLRGGRLGSAARAVGRIAVKPPPSYHRRCLVQGRYVQHGRVVAGNPIDLQASARQHLAYVEREGVERDGSAGRLYATAVPHGPEPQSGATVAVRASLAEPLAGEQHQFRFIISPEDAGELELTDYVRELMRRVELDLGQRLVWGAVNHYNTAHPHAHVVVRGVDRDGRQVRFDPEYMKRGFRARAEELATEWLGPRTELEYRQQLEREVEQQRYTTLDRGISAKARDGFVRHEDLSETQRKRVQFLETLGVARRAPEGSWRLEIDWDRKLRRLGERGDLIKQMHQSLRQVDTSRFVICGDDVPRSPIEGELVHGRIAAIGLRDNVPEGMYAMVETVRGSGYYVPLSPAQSEKVREGDHVTLRRWTDRKGKGRLTIDTSRLSIDQQVTYLGPTWLDTARPSGSSEFARTIAQRQREREAYLRERQLGGVDLRSVERRRLTEYYARKLGLERAKRLDDFVGRLITIHDAPSGRSYAVIASDTEVVLMRATAQTRALTGRAVRLASVRDTASKARDKPGRGRLEVEPLEHER